MVDTYYICTETECNFTTRFSSLGRIHEYETGHDVGVRRVDREPA